MFRFCTQAEPMPSTWPFALNLMGPPRDIFSVMLVWRMASASVLGSVLFARLKASAAINIASKVKPALRPWNTRLSFGFAFLNAASTRLVMFDFGLYQGTLETEYSESLPSVLKYCSSYMPGEPGLTMPIGCQRCFTISRRRMMASFRRQTSSRKSAFDAFAFDTSTDRSFAAGS